MTRYTVLAVNDDKDFCQCCGKAGLKRVVWIENTETNEVLHFGTTCATAPTKGFGVEKEIKNAISRFDSKQKVLNYLTHCEYKKAGGKYGPMDEATGVFPCLDPELRNRIRADISARGFNY